jgi:SAM-dependent methyltransferase
VTGHAYPGTELELFRRATRWKRYYARTLRPFISGDVLEVGAGLGGTTAHLCSGAERSWTCLEPDDTLRATAQSRLGSHVHGVPLAWGGRFLGDLAPDRRFDTVLYIDVLEHIETDADELGAAAARLHPGGRVVVLSPAHGWLFSEFDRAVGHCRRYTAHSLRRLTPATTRLVLVRYFDSIGALLSLANRLLLRQSEPNQRQIAFWDSCVVPLSTIADVAFKRVIGRSIVAVWERT